MPPIVLCLFVFQDAYPQTLSSKAALASAGAKELADHNIIITNSTDIYRFTYDKHAGKVVIRQESEDDYTCTHYRTGVLFADMFNKEITLDNIEVRQDGKKLRKLETPVDYVAVDGEFYSDARICHFPLEFDKNGSTNEVTISKTISDPLYFAPIIMAKAYPVRNKVVKIIVPAWMKIDLHTYHFSDFAVHTIHSHTPQEDVYTYTVKNLPARRSLAEAPGPTYIWPNILVCSKNATPEGEMINYFNSLDDQYKWYHNLSLHINNDTAVIAAKARDITKGVSNDWAKIKSIFYYVEGHIRYLAYEDGIAGFLPANAQDVLQKKYGDCKGMANLTKALLKSLGYDARLCWLGTNYIFYDYSTPSLSVDNHMICALKYDDKWYYLDATEGFMQPGVYSGRIQGRQVLIEDGDSYLLKKIPTVAPEQNKRVFTENLKIDGTSLKGNINYDYNGESKVELMNIIQATNKDQLEHKLVSYITNDNKDYHISDIKHTSLDQRDGNFNIDFLLDYTNAVSSFGNEIYIDVDYNKELNNALIDTDNRKEDMQFNYKFDYVTETSIAIPKGYKIETLPDSLHFQSSVCSFNISYQQEDNRIIYHKELKLKNTYLKQSAFAQWNEGIKQLSKKYLDQIVLVKS